MLTGHARLYRYVQKINIFIIRSNNYLQTYMYSTWRNNIGEQGVVTPICPVLTSTTAVKNFDQPNRALTAPILPH